MDRLQWLAMGSLVLWCSSSAFGQENSCDALINDAESAWIKNDFSASDLLLTEAQKSCPERAEIYWRKARNEYDRLESVPRERKPSKDTLLERYQQMEQNSDQCALRAPQDGSCYLWKAISLARQGTTLGILHPESLKRASEVEELFLKAAQLKPTYRASDGSANTLGDTYMALGQYYRIAPEWTCYVPLLGICGDLDKSLEYTRKAMAREPKRIEYAKELGAILLCHGQKKNNENEVQEGKTVLTALQTFPETKPYDKMDKAHAEQLIANPAMACGYSRDGQQEQSKKAL